MSDFELLENVLQFHCPSILKDLQPGLQDGELKKMLTDTTLCYDDIKAIYSWRNGTSKASSPVNKKNSFHPFGNFLSLDTAVALKHCLEEEGHLEGNLFPFLSNNDGDILLLDVDKKSSSYGFVYIMSSSMLLIPPITIYDSFNCFVKSLSHCYSSGSYKFNKKSNEIEINLKHEAIFSKTINPHSEFWKDDQ